MSVSLTSLNFNNLDNNSKRALYQEANEKHDVPLVKRLNSFGMAPAGTAVFYRPSIISTSMDIGTKYDTILRFLHQLRDANRLMTKEEFRQSPLKDKKWRKKKQLGRILGCDYLIQKISECRLIHAKTPHKIAVVKGSGMLDMIGWEFSNAYYHFDSKQITIYAEEIPTVQRTFSRVEIDELFKIIEEVNFVDLHPENILLAEEGFYFIDTEFKSFAGIVPWGNLGRFEHLIADEDKQYFHEKIREKMAQPPLKKENLGYFYLESRLETLSTNPEKNKAAIEEIKKKKCDLEYVGAREAGISWLRPNLFKYPLNEVLKSDQ